MSKRKKKKVKKESNKRIIAIIVILLVIAAIFLALGFLTEEESFASSNREPVIVTPESLPAYLESFRMIEDLPKKANIHVSFGNLDYTVNKGDVKQGLSGEADVKINLPGEYVGKIGFGLCGSIKEAVNKGELGIETSLSEAELLWRYKGMLKYRECVGL